MKCESSSTNVYEIVILPEARQDMIEIASYIANDSPQAALDFHARLIERIRNLSQMPEAGALVPDLNRLTRSELRRVMVKPYSIFYAVVSYDVIVYRVVHQKRDKELSAAMLGILLREEWNH